MEDFELYEHSSRSQSKQCFFGKGDVKLIKLHYEVFNLKRSTDDQRRGVRAGTAPGMLSTSFLWLAIPRGNFFLGETTKPDLASLSDIKHMQYHPRCPNGSLTKHDAFHFFGVIIIP